MNIFDSLQMYAGQWQVVNSRNFSDEERNAVVGTEIVASQYGKSVCFFMKSGQQAYIPVSNTCDPALGSSIDMEKAKVITLSRPGDANIQRVEL